jgi:hypothetical protein
MCKLFRKIFRRKRKEEGYKPVNNLERWHYREIELYILLSGMFGNISPCKDLRDSADKKTKTLSKDFSHRGTQKIFRALKKKGLRSPAEILQRNESQATAREILDRFLESEEHREIIESPLYKYVGIRIIGNYTCIHFAR